MLHPEYISTRKTPALSNLMAQPSPFETFAVGEPGVFTLSDVACLRQIIGQGCRRGVYAGQTGTPMTYMLDSKQYIVVAIGGQNYPSESVAFRLFNQL